MRRAEADLTDDRPRTGFLTRTDLRRLGLERRAIDAIFRELPVVCFPEVTRFIGGATELERLIETSTYRGDRVRPVRGSV